MKHEAILEGQDLLPRDPRVETGLAVRVHCEAGDIEAQIVNLSADGFRLQSANPLQAGWVVTLQDITGFPSQGADLLGERSRRRRRVRRGGGALSITPSAPPRLRLRASGCGRAGRGR